MGGEWASLNSGWLQGVRGLRSWEFDTQVRVKKIKKKSFAIPRGVLRVKCNKSGISYVCVWWLWNVSAVDKQIYSVSAYRATGRTIILTMKLLFTESTLHLERRRSAWEHWLPLRKTWVQFLAPTQWPRTISTVPRDLTPSSSFLGHQAQKSVDIHASKTLYMHN